MNKNGESLDEDELLLQESRQLHHKLKAQRRSERLKPGQYNQQKATPIKEEDIEEEFEENDKSKTTEGVTSMAMEEARNYDSHLTGLSGGS